MLIMRWDTLIVAVAVGLLVAYLVAPARRLTLLQDDDDAERTRRTPSRRQVS